MTDYTIVEIAEAVNAVAEYDDEYFWGEFEWREKRDEPVSLSLRDESVLVECVESRYGEEGDWAVGTYVIIKVGTQFFKKNGYYRSHDGEYWDGVLEEVKPTQKYITVYE